MGEVRRAYGLWRPPLGGRWPVAAALVFCLLWVAGANAQAPPADAAEAPVIASFAIHGVEAVSERDLRAILQTRASPRLPWRERERLDPAVLEADVQRVEEFYAARGFREATVTSAVEPLDAGTVRVRLTIVEGEPVRLAGFRFEGFAGIVDARALARLAEAAPVQPGDPLAVAGVVEAGHRALDLVRDAGYPRARITFAEAPADRGWAYVMLRAAPGPIGLVGRVDIAGNRRVDDPVIRRHVALQPGERFRLEPIHVTHRRLMRLGLFESVDIDLANPEGVDTDVGIVVRVHERDLRAYQFSFGYGTEEQISGEAEWQHVNVLGGARRLSVLGRWSWLDRGVQAGLVQPYVLHPDVSLGFVGQVWSVDDRFFDQLSAGGGASLTYRHGPFNVASLTFSQRFERSRISEAAVADPDLRASLEALFLDGATGIQRGALSSLQLDLARDTRDVPLDPRRGYWASLRFEQVGGWLPGAFDLHAAVGDARHFVSWGPLTLAHRAQYGSVWPAGGAADVPLFRRFFLGGADSLRGWGRLEVSPLSQAGQPVGGRAFFAATSEARVPLARRLGLAGFLDAGNVWRSAWRLHPGDLRYSAGAGVRYDSPVGPLRLDGAYQLTPIAGLRVEGAPETRRWRLHFTLGRGF
jgi:outer membrane protein assembly complex protein YaeT